MTYDIAPYPCRFTNEPMKIDGLLDEAAWQNAEVLDFYIPVTDEAPISKTEGRLLWDENYLYVGYRAYDKDIWSYFTERDSWNYQEDVLEVFFKTDPSREPYYNFEINALGTIYDAFNLKMNAGGPMYHRWNRWNSEDTRTAVYIKGKINKPETIDEYWQLEMAIPFADLPTLGEKTPSVGDTWLFHLARYDYSIHLPDGVELSSCAKLPRASFHDYEHWLPLRFERSSRI